MLLNKLLSALTALMLLLFGSMSFAGLLPESTGGNSNKTGDDRKVSNTIRNDTEVKKDVEDEKTPEEEIVDDTPAEPSQLFVNNAPEFYYYSLLTEDGKKLYDMLVELMVHPEIADLTVQKDISISPETPEFDTMYHQVREAVEYDHPELFWYFAQDTYPFRMSIYTQPNEAGNYRVTMSMATPFSDYETVMGDFNRAANAFLAEIDRTQPPAQIALAIHDRLLDLCSYDYETADRGLTGLAHSAYGALVDNGRGTANNCVCDGYAKAYTYLLQQSGIISAQIIGYAGSESMGLHAWNCILLDGEWYEVDVTWDDADPAHDFADRPDHVEAMLADSAYMDTCRHAYFLLTTDSINNFTVDDDRYTLNLGDMIYYLHGSSKRIRVTAQEGWPIANDFPVANGSTYTYETLKNG